MLLNIVGFLLYQKGTMMLTESLIQMRQNSLVVMYIHLVVVQLHGDQPDKPLLLDQQWNQSLLLLKRLEVKLRWLKNSIANIPLGMKPTSFVSIHCDCQSAIAIAKNNTYNGKNRHIQLRHNLVKQLLKRGTISIDYVKSERNLADPLTKPLGRNMILETSRGMGLKPLANKQVMETQPL